ncbi:DUF2306 domain-containing protein [Paenibacillus montanisoli]|uniref:DUF2306 domain-containing protein n=2 Tax=Paenibacillus montanisoli TaxID=2081970 RepID=A0A328TSN0_9BACL|nr:DUF2306 domain-containing protein [Paenibacillus montanisoli]
MLAVAAGFMLHAIYANFLYDPQADRFLSQKIDLKRQFNKPVWLNVMYMHIGFACIATVAGTVNFASKVRNKYRRLHRVLGYVYVAAVVAVCLTSGYMAPYATGGKVTSVPFNLLNILWVGLSVISIAKIRKKQRIAHRNWMVRSYAFCFTNMCIHLITALVHQGFGASYTLSYTIGVYGAIAFLLLAGELIVRMLNGREKGVRLL